MLIGVDGRVARLEEDQSAYGVIRTMSAKILRLPVRTAAAVKPIELHVRQLSEGASLIVVLY